MEHSGKTSHKETQYIEENSDETAVKQSKHAFEFPELAQLDSGRIVVQSMRRRFIRSSSLCGGANRAYCVNFSRKWQYSHFVCGAAFDRLFDDGYWHNPRRPVFTRNKPADESYEGSRVPTVSRRKVPSLIIDAFRYQVSKWP